MLVNQRNIRMWWEKSCQIFTLPLAIGDKVDHTELTNSWPGTIYSGLQPPLLMHDTWTSLAVDITVPLNLAATLSMWHHQSLPLPGPQAYLRKTHLPRKRSSHTHWHAHSKGGKDYAQCRTCSLTLSVVAGSHIFCIILGPLLLTNGTYTTLKRQFPLMMYQHTLDHSYEPLRVAPWSSYGAHNSTPAIPGRGAKNIYPNHLVKNLNPHLKRGCLKNIPIGLHRARHYAWNSWDSLLWLWW